MKSKDSQTSKQKRWYEMGLSDMPQKQPVITWIIRLTVGTALGATLALAITIPNLPQFKSRAQVYQPAASQPTIVISADRTIGTMRTLTGFLHGITYDKTKDYAQTIKLISDLKPKFWRFSSHSNNVYDFVANNARFPQTQGTKMKFVLQDAFARSTVGQSFPTFNDFKMAWGSFIDAYMKQSPNNAIIDIYDIFAEPDFKQITPDQLFELFKIAHNIIRQYKPDAKIEALETAQYHEYVFKQFLTYVANNKLRLDALSWNEFGNPEDVVGHIKIMRNFIATKPELCNPRCPEIYIDEYAHSNNHLIPGWNVGWLYYFNKAGADQIHKACWDVNGGFSKSGWSTCWDGFNGMLLNDNITPQNIYWVYKTYADMDGWSQLPLLGSSKRVVALATRNDLTKKIIILAGRYDGQSGPVIIQVNNYSYGLGRVKVEVFKIPDNGNASAALASPVVLPVSYTAIQNGSIKISLDNFKNGEAYSILISAK